MALHKEEIIGVYKSQKAFFDSGATRSYRFRKQQIKALRQAIKSHETELLEALHSDMGKPAFEAFGSEIGFMYNEISHTLKRLYDWMSAERVPTSIAHFPTRSRIVKVPKGQVLILSPWNYPFQLLINPLLAAIAAGNTAIVKLPWQTPATAEVMDKMLQSIYDTEFVACLRIADEEVIPELFQSEIRFDHVFFTGSTRVGKLIMSAAAEQLVPLTLELGGKSPAIVDRSASLKVAAKRIIWGKAFNAGQTCVAPDYVLVHNEVKERFMSLLIEAAKDCISEYGGIAAMSRIINEHHFERLAGLSEGEQIVYDAGLDSVQLQMGLRIVQDPSMASRLMKEEIFGPVLPVLGYSDEQDLKAKLSTNPEPLSFYLFSTDKRLERRLVQDIPFGGGCINNCLIHLSNPEVPFGGIGRSGMGQYHSRYGFDAFSHHKTILKTGTWIDPPMRYPRYSSWKMKILRALFR